MAKDGVLRYPIIAVNDAQTKHLFDNRYGTGQSTLDGILRATNVLLAGLKFVVAGYGMCGKGVAMRARGAGAHVIVTEVNPIRAIEAVMDGYEVMPMAEAAPVGDVFLTVTGNKAVIRRGALPAHEGRGHRRQRRAFQRRDRHPGPGRPGRGKRRVREFVDEYTLRDGRRIHLLGEGRLINLAAAEGHPAMVMDMSFANQALSVRWLLGRAKGLPKTVFPVPVEIDEEIASLKLASMGTPIDKLTPAQKKYLAELAGRDLSRARGPEAASAPVADHLQVSRDRVLGLGVGDLVLDLEEDLLGPGVIRVLEISDGQIVVEEDILGHDLDRGLIGRRWPPRGCSASRK